MKYIIIVLLIITGINLSAQVHVEFVNQNTRDVIIDAGAKNFQKAEVITMSDSLSHCFLRFKTIEDLDLSMYLAKDFDKKINSPSFILREVLSQKQKEEFTCYDLAALEAGHYLIVYLDKRVRGHLYINIVKE